jgi:predicted DNA repair protein MutK
MHGKKKRAAHQEVPSRAGNPTLDASAEKDKIKGAVRTDFILSAEIIAITLGTVQESPLVTQLTVMIVIAAAMTVGVYGFVAAIVKLDDGGLYLSRVEGASAFARFERALGRGILAAAPWLMKTLSVVGTAAMFLVGGAILTHGIPFLHHWVDALAQSATTLGGSWLGSVASGVVNGMAGVLAGATALLLWTLLQRLRATPPNASHG